MDNDSTTVARVKATVDSDIEKKPDKNYTRKTNLETILKNVSCTASANTKTGLKN